MDYRIFLEKREKDIKPVDNKIPVILASASPRRRELMPLICKSFEICVSGAEEVSPGNIATEKLPEYYAELKCNAVSKENPGKTVIGCDTAVMIDSVILGKPRDGADAVRMLKLLSGRTNTVLSGVCISDGIKKVAFTAASEVTFKKLTDVEINAYVASGEPLDKAGAYGIQGGAFGFVSAVSGSCYNVIGFPVNDIKDALVKNFTF